MSEYKETLHDSYGQIFEVDNVLYENKTDNFDLVIFENKQHGRVLALDGIIQTCESDEFIYHEMLAHVPLFANDTAECVLVIGGGDGGILREIVKHTKIERIVQVEIDQDVIDMSKEYLPNHSNGAFDDHRLEIVIADGAEYVKTCKEQFDVIIIDSTDPIGPGEVLFQEEFYENCYDLLPKYGGVIVTQNGVPFYQPAELTQTHQSFSKIAKQVQFYTAAVPTYVGGVMTFGYITNSKADFIPHSNKEILAEDFHDSGIETKYYDNEIHHASFVLPKYIKGLLSED